MDKLPITEERQKQVDMLEQYTNAVLTIATVSKQLIEDLFKRHKELNISMSKEERSAYNKIKDGAGLLEHRAFQSKYCDFKKFKKSVLMVKFLMLELISRCDDSNMRVWQFHNLLQTFKIVYPGVTPTLNDEYEAFSDLFGHLDK